MTYYVGIDVSSQKLNIHIIGKEVRDFEILNKKESLHEFIKTQELCPENSIIGVESTGKYHLICQDFFVPLGFKFRVINPILTNKKISATVRKKKTDISDAKIIAQFVLQKEGNVVSEKQTKTTQKTLLRTRKSLVGQKSAIKTMIKDLRLVRDDEQIQDAIKTLESLVSDMEKRVKEIEKNSFKNPPTEEALLIKSIPGFALLLASIISAEIGDFARFPSSTQFKAYVGIDPKVNQSGESLRTSKITKRGSPILRHAFYLAAQVARLHDPELKLFFEKKRNEGKPYRVALIAVVRKLCERVYAVVRRGTPYVIQRHSFS